MTNFPLQPHLPLFLSLYHSHISPGGSASNTKKKKKIKKNVINKKDFTSDDKCDGKIEN